ncbi:Sgpl1, partial [Symbiodinium sp. KB8]
PWNEATPAAPGACLLAVATAAHSPPRALCGIARAPALVSAARDLANCVSQLVACVASSCPDRRLLAAALLEMPREGLNAKDVLETLKTMREHETRMRDGTATGGIYSDPFSADTKTMKELQADVWRLYSASNALYPGIYPSVRKIEAELIRMTLSMCSAPAEGPHCGLLTSGGTESVLLATKAYRDSFRSSITVLGRLMGACGPVEVVAGATRHPALDKAVKCFGMRLVTVPVNESTGFRMRPADVAAAIGPRTAFVYASAPTFPHGMVDPIAELGKLCQRRGVGLHVDNCLGGVLMSGMRDAGIAVPEFDFAVPGVTSMSVDLHKYGLASKGASTALFSSRELRAHAFVPVADFPGGFYVTPTMQGSRSGALMAQAWATMVYMGRDGYTRLARSVDSMVRRFAAGVEAIDGLRLLVRPDCSCVAFTSDVFCIYALVERMEHRRGWAFVTLQKPKAAQLCLMQAHERSLATMLTDLSAEAAYLREHPDTKATGMAGAYAVVENLPPSAAFGTLKGYQALALDVVPVAAPASSATAAAAAAAAGSHEA